MTRRPPTQGNSKDNYRNKGRGERKSTEKEPKKLERAGRTAGGMAGKNAGGMAGKNAGGMASKNTGGMAAGKNTGGAANKNDDGAAFKNAGKGKTYKDGINAKELGSLKANDGKNYKKNAQNRVFYENDFIFWCRECNVPLIGETCGLCGSNGEKITLSQPADVRFAQGYDNELIEKHLIRLFSCNPLEGRIVLLNKIPGDDQSMEIIADGHVIGILRFDLNVLDFIFEPTIYGSKLFVNEPYRFAAAGRIVKIQKAKSHVNGKNISFDSVEDFPAGIKKGEAVLIMSGGLTGYGISHIESEEYYRLKKEREKAGTGDALFREMSTLSDEETKANQILKVKNITSEDPLSFKLSEKKPSMDDIIAANKEHIKSLGKDAMNVIKGAAGLKENKDKPVYVSFSGGKDSLVVLDLAASALIHRPFTAVFLNTGIDYPETVEFAKTYCAERRIPFKEMSAGDDFWKTLQVKDHPTKDGRWCCKVCKLNSSNRLADGKEHLSLDGKRRHESFMRSKIPTMDTNPNVEGQLNIFPIRDWRAIEVWLYIRWRKLPYNPLYDNGLERIGCWMCPAAFQAEYVRMKEIHPELAGIWETYLAGWAKRNGVSDEYVRHGLWRWEQLPPKMIKLAEELNISLKNKPEK
ncbi:MAG: phosphoadenosine phosphosulfate reductase family protein [Methanimicrococcus sp.]|nr:phosphoadenosine phosphosulfate reductase family protein [Methanimicrococcus sp.]